MHLMVTGRFTDVESTISFDEQEPANSHAEVTIGAASVDTRMGKRDTLARQGYTVFATMRGVEGKNAAAATALRAWAAQESLALQPLELDVTDDASVEHTVGHVLAAAGRIDVVVSNAAVGYIGPIEGFTPEQVRAQFETNVVGVLRVNRAVLPQMRRQGAGLLVYVSSGAGRLVVPTLAVYCATKWAAEALAEGARYELASFGIDSVIVQPGGYPTDAAAKAVPPADTARLAPYGPTLAAFNAAFGATLEAGQVGDPQKVADAIAALIATGAGQRPLRTVVAHVEQERVQQTFLSAMGLGPLVTLRTPEAGDVAAPA
jgi:NAD(P)-dependent dehydrogenase (short-subunit alcohol dehydrogenase family)